jgi:hypothetical protein
MGGYVALDFGVPRPVLGGGCGSWATRSDLCLGIPSHEICQVYELIFLFMFALLPR